ncbi:hypothetical protein PROFUN_02712 [Planoprotostelium fungivorum]|uniref:Uncharacterized protein n=2 Tax=Planoprotostelium fungivorum TaxID=1890364 RepID=A0A2P6NVI2_9EUKA|nr:hypothetical protein PROFUN_02712 [Planoprotostelium fungivorum]
MVNKVLLLALALLLVVSAWENPAGNYTRTRCKCNLWYPKCESFFDRDYEVSLHDGDNMEMKPIDTSYTTVWTQTKNNNTEFSMGAPKVGTCIGSLNEGDKDITMKCKSDVFSRLTCDVAFKCAAGPCLG